MGMVASGALGSTVEADSSLLWPVPQYWSLEDAATVPCPYVHAYYCLVRIKVGNINKLLIGALNHNFYFTGNQR